MQRSGDVEHVFREECGTTLLGNQPSPELSVSLHHLASFLLRAH